MRTTSPGTPKRVAVSLLAGALAFLGIAFAGPAGATADVVTEDRAAGATRYGTGADAANTAYPDGNDTVIIASGETFPDALSASGLAGHLDAPVMLTQENSLPEETLAGIEELGAATAVIVGGTAAVSDTVRDALEDEGLTVDRIAGDNRFETAGAVADEIGTYTRAIVASGEVAADALSAGPIAADQEDGPSPILLVTANEVPNATAQALDGVTEVLVVGGTARITDATADEAEGHSADADAERIAGLDRQATAALIAEWTTDHMGWAPDGVLLAAPRSPSDDFSPDALVGGPLGAILDDPILIIDECGSVGPDGIAFLEAHSDTIAQIIPIGGTAVICDEAVEEAAEAAGDVAGESNQTFACTGGGFGFLDNDDEDASAVPFDCDTGSAETVSIELVACDNVTTDEDGVVTFLDDENDGVGNNRADGLGDTDAFIEVINGVAVDEDDSVEDVEPSNGGVTFSVNTESPLTGCVIPVVYDDANGNGQLDLGADDTPTEQFGIGGETTFVPPEAEPGSIDPNCPDGFWADDEYLVVNVAKDVNAFVAWDTDLVDCFGPVNLFFYDANDIFTVDGLPASLATFEAELSKADSVGGTYADDPEAVSTLNLSDHSPAAPDVTATEHDGNDVTIEVESNWPPLNSDLFGDEDLIRIFRAEFDPADFDEEECADVDTFEFDDNFDPETTDDYEMIFEGTMDDESADADEDDAVFEYEDTDLDASCYVYTATLVIDGDESDPGEGDTFDDVRVDIGTTEATAPLIIDTDLDEGIGTPAVIDTGDTVTIQFNEPMSPDIAVDGIVRVTDPDGEVFEIDCTPNTCTLGDGDANDDDDTTDANDQDSLLTIVLTTDPLKVGGPGDEDGFAQVPSTITELSTNFDDLSGNQVDLANSTDKVIDNELG